MARIVLISLVAFVSFFSAVYSAKYKCAGVAHYMLSFYGKWSNMTHTGAFPANGHFSPLIGCSHEEKYTMWEDGMKASTGVKDVAETGITTALENEIKMQMMTNKTVWKHFIASGPTDGTGHLMGLDVYVSQTFPLVSLVTMLAPSPDWFTGIKKMMDLCDSSTGMWRDGWNVTMLTPWDAGTEEGNTFSMNNAATDPQGNISMIIKNSDTPFKNVPQANIATLGMLMFQRKNKPVMGKMCSGEQMYKLKFQAMWTEENQPNGFPSGAHFSTIVGATHTYRYKFWSDMTRASPGVKLVAETGAPSTLYNEIMAMVKENFVFKAFKSDDTVPSPGEKIIEITVKDRYSMVSLISMLAPSPDWFVGIDSLDLCGSDGMWRDDVMMNLLPWDAGTDSGENFNSGNMPTMPYDLISRISENSTLKEDANKAFAKVTFMKYDKPTASAHSSSAGVLTLLPIALVAILRLLH